MKRERSTSPQHRATAMRQGSPMQVEPSTEIKEAVTAVAPAQTGTVVRPRRPDFGTTGKSIRVRANFFRVTFKSEVTIFHYDVAVTPTIGSAAVRRQLFDAWVRQESQSADATLAAGAKICIYDGQKNLFAPRDLGIGMEGRLFRVDLQESGDQKITTYEIKLAEVKQLDLFALSRYLSNDHPANTSVELIDYPRDMVSALEVLMRHWPSSKFATFGRGGGSFFSEQGASPLKGGLEVFFGWSQSLRPVLGPIMPGNDPRDMVTYKTLLLNLDVAATAFYQSGPLVDVVAAFFNERDIEGCRRYMNNADDLRALGKFLNNVSCDINYRQGRTRYKIYGLSRTAVAETMVTIEEPEPRNISVATFFRDQYNITLRYPWLPAVSVNRSKETWIPMELMRVREHQRYMHKVSDLQVAEMIKVTAVPPTARAERIQTGIRSLHDQNDADFLRSWGVEVKSDMVDCEARVLPAPKMTFNKDSARDHTISVPDGTWRFDRDRGFAVPKPLKIWGVAVFASPNQLSQRDVEGFIEGLLRTLKDLKMDVDMSMRPRDVIFYADRNEAPEDTLTRAHDQILRRSARSRDDRVDMIFCILNHQNAAIYSAIKRESETRLGVVTQCCIGKHVKKDPSRNRPYFSNIALKINAKLGGVNSFLHPKAELPDIVASQVPTMIIGADVTHPPVGMSGESIAAMTGTMDYRFCQYRSVLRTQQDRSEIIEDIGGMVRELFEMFKESSRVFPERVIIYRDGVSEGQFGAVVYEEVSALKRMFRQLCPGKIPDVTFVVMNKRHHVRFFPVNRGDADNKGNMFAGTVIDRDVVHPFEFDFFLYSHAGLQGTSRPAHYHVLLDENGFNADTLQQLTYRLCYLFCRSTRAVSLVPPAYYAHLLAARAKCYIDDRRGESLVNKVRDDIRRKMYFV